MTVEAKEGKSVFETLNTIDVSDRVEKKNNLSYLSWAWAWGEIKKRYPDTTYTVYESAAGLNYHTDGKTCWVKCGVTCGGIENIEYLPVMDYRNLSIPLERVTSYDVNKSIQRCITKAIARHGLGLYIYAGEDLPEGNADPDQPGTGKNQKAGKQTGAGKTAAPEKTANAGAAPLLYTGNEAGQEPVSRPDIREHVRKNEAPAAVQTPNLPKNIRATPGQITQLLALYNDSRRASMLKYHGITGLDQLSAEDAQRYINIAMKNKEAESNG